MSRFTELLRQERWGLGAAVAVALLLAAPQLGPGTTVPRDILATALPWSLELSGPPSNNALGDALTQGYPAYKFLHDAVIRGELPLWNPLVLGGTPLAADPSNAVFYPPNLLLAGLEPATVFDLQIVLHLLIASIGSYALARVWGAGPAGSVLTAAAFCGSSALTVWRFHAYQLATASWAPLLFASFEVALLRRFSRLAAVSALTLGLLITANFAQWAIYTILLFGAYAVWVAVAHPDPQIRGLRSVAMAAGVILFGLGVGAVQLAPLLELSGLSTRSGPLPFDQLEARTQDIRKLLTLLSPNFFGTPVRGATRWVAGHPVYWGVFPCILALAAPLWRREGRVRFLWWALALAISVTWGAPTLRLLVVLPGLDRLPPHRVAFVVCLLGSVLAGLSFDGLCDRLRAARLRAFLPATLFAGAALSAGVILLSPPSRVSEAQRAALTPILLLTAAALVLAVGRGRVGKLGRAALVALTVVDIAAYSVAFSPPSVPLDNLIPLPRILQDLPRTPVPTRVVVVRGKEPAIPPNLLASFGFSDLAGYSSLVSASTARYLGYINGGAATAATTVAPEGRRSIERVYAVQRADSPLLDLAGVEYIISDAPLAASGLRLLSRVQGLNLFRNLETAPRAFVVDAARIATSNEEEERLLVAPGFHACRYAVLAAPAPPVETERDGQCLGEARIETFRRNEVRLVVSTPAAGVLVLAEAYHPGWQANLDGRPVSVLRADGAFRGVIVPPGRHEVVFRFRPASVSLGGAVSLAAMLGLAITALPWGRRRALPLRPEHG